MPDFLGININDKIVSCSIFSLNKEKIYSYYEKIKKSTFSDDDIILKQIKLLPKVFAKLNKKIQPNIHMVGFVSGENMTSFDVSNVAMAISHVHNAKYIHLEFLKCLIMETLFSTNKLHLINKKFIFIDSDKEEMNIYSVSENLYLNKNLQVTKENLDYKQVVNFFMETEDNIDIVIANNDFREINILGLDIFLPKNLNFAAVNKKNISAGAALLAGYKYER